MAPIHHSFTTCKMPDQTIKRPTPKGRKDWVPANPPACNQHIPSEQLGQILQCLLLRKNEDHLGNSNQSSPPGGSPHHTHHPARSKATRKIVANEVNFACVVLGR